MGDARRLEVVVDGLSLCGGRQLAVDTTLVEVLHANGQPILQTKMGCALSLLVVEKKGPTPNWLADGAEPRWLSSLEKSVDGGQERPGLS